MATSLGISIRFVEISMARYKRKKEEEPEKDVTVWEQVFEMWKQGDPESDWTKDRQERREKEFSLSISEQIEAIKIFLANPEYPVEIFFSGRCPAPGAVLPCTCYQWESYARPPSPALPRSGQYDGWQPHKIYVPG
jgi:hypothetical protein